MQKEDVCGNRSLKDIDVIKRRVQFIMEKKLSIIRRDQELREAKEDFFRIKKDLSYHRLENPSYIELINSITVGLLITESAIRRRKNIGAHYNLNNKKKEENSCIINL